MNATISTTKDVPTETDDAPTLEPTMTAVICEHPATDRPAAYDFEVWAAIVSASSDTAKRVLEDSR